MSILKDLKRDHTILMITHKPQLMKMADEIIVIDNGKLVGKGNHKELSENNKYYVALQKWWTVDINILLKYYKVNKKNRRCLFFCYFIFYK